MSASQQDAFFVGYINAVPRSLVRFLTGAILCVALLLGFAALILSVQDRDADGGHFEGEVKVSGRIETLPYPLLRVAPDTTHPKGHVILLAGEGKRGVQQQALALEGKNVTVKGYLAKRGTLDMVISADAFVPAPDAVLPATAAVSLGRWQMQGEICDGKCSLGAMRPGTGLAHKACANLCLTGGVPPILVTDRPFEGTHFFLLADHDGAPAPALMLDMVGQPVQLEGEMFRLDDLLIFQVDWIKAVLL